MAEPTVPQRQLPIPHPSPAQTSRNVVDQLQDQRLRSVVAPTSLSPSNAYPKPPLLNHSDGDLQTASTAESAVASDSVISYMSSCSAQEIPVSSVGAQPQLNFGTSNLLDAMPAPAVPATYSNFRNYGTPTASSSKSISNVTRQNSPTSAYSLGVNDRRHATSDVSSDGTLVGGARFTPYHAGQSHNRTSFEGLRRDSLGKSSISVERGGMGSHNRTY